MPIGSERDAQKLSENVLIVLDDIDEGGFFNPHWRFGARAKRMHGSLKCRRLMVLVKILRLDVFIHANTCFEIVGFVNQYFE
jgi:hypothetical protein